MNYPARRSRDVPDHRPESVYRYEDHIEYCYGFRNLRSWKDSEGHTRLSLERGMCTIYGPTTMRDRDQLQIAQDTLSWIEGGPLSHEYVTS